MNSMLSVALLMSGMMVIVTAEDSAQIVSFRKSRMEEKGPGKCALDAALDDHVVLAAGLFGQLCA